MRLYSCLSWQPIRSRPAQKCVFLAKLGCELRIWLSPLIVSALFVAGLVFEGPCGCYVTFRIRSCDQRAPEGREWGIIGASSHNNLSIVAIRWLEINEICPDTDGITPIHPREGSLAWSARIGLDATSRPYWPASSDELCGCAKSRCPDLLRGCAFATVLRKEKPGADCCAYYRCRRAISSNYRKLGSPERGRSDWVGSRARAASRSPWIAGGRGSAEYGTASGQVKARSSQGAFRHLWWKIVSVGRNVR